MDIGFDKKDIEDLLEMVLFHNDAYEGNGEKIICFQTLYDIIMGVRQVDQISVSEIDNCIVQMVTTRDFFEAVGCTDFGFFDKCIYYFKSLLTNDKK